MKIVIYGTGGTTEMFLQGLRELENHYSISVDIVYFAASKRKIDTFHGIPVKNADEIKETDFDYLVIASTDENYAEIIVHLQSCQPKYKNIQSKILRYFDFTRLIKEKLPHDEIVFTNEGLQYVCDSTDMVIRRHMENFGTTYSWKIIHSFFELTDLYYGKRERTGIFLDIGANIGTTAIYVKKRMNSSLRVIGFEPGTQNYKRFRANCILNDADDIEIVHTALGENNGNAEFFLFPGNSGAGHIADSKESRNDVFNDFVWQETVKLSTLDDYLIFENIQAEKIDYIWIDVEGHESKIIQGAMQTLLSKRIPLIQEFSPACYQDFDMYMQNLKHVYDHFVVVSEYIQRDKEGHWTVYAIDQLAEYAKNMNSRGIPQEDLFFF